MAWPLPILTWEMSTLESLSSPAITDICAALHTIFTASTTWEVKAGNGTTDDYLEVGPIAGADAAYANQRVIFAGGANPNTLSSYFSTDTNPRLWINFCHDVTGRTQVAADWQTQNPFAGAAKTGTGFMRLGDTISNHTSIWCLICEEGILVNLRKSAECYPYLAGALIDPGHANGGDANNRRWLAASQGSGGSLTASFHSSTNTSNTTYFLKNYSTSSNRPHSFAYRESSSSWQHGVADTAHNHENVKPNSYADLEDEQGYLVPPPVRFVRQTSYNPTQMMGFLRQIYFCINGRDRQVGQDVSLNDLFYLVAKSLTADSDAFMFTNY